MTCPTCHGLGGYPLCPTCQNNFVINEVVPVRENATQTAMLEEAYKLISAHVPNLGSKWIEKYESQRH